MHLSIIDQETKKELSEFGLEVQEPVKACCDCRYIIKSSLDGSYNTCGARGYRFVEYLNSNCNCPHWRPKEKSLSKINQVNKLSVFSIVLAVLAIILSLL